MSNSEFCWIRLLKFEISHPVAKIFWIKQIWVYLRDCSFNLSTVWTVTWESLLATFLFIIIPLTVFDSMKIKYENNGLSINQIQNWSGFYQPFPKLKGLLSTISKTEGAPSTISKNEGASISHFQNWESFYQPFSKLKELLSTISKLKGLLSTISKTEGASINHFQT